MTFSREVTITVADKKGSEILHIEKNPSELTVDQLKREVMKKTNVQDVNRVNLTLHGTTLDKKEKTLYECGVKDHVNITYKDLGTLIPRPQLGIIAYFSPIILLLLIYMTISKPTQLQKVAVFLSVIHYLKRWVEVTFIENHSDMKVPVKETVTVVIYYWGLFALGVGLNLRNNEYNPSIFIIYFWAGAMLVFEFLNFMAHYALAQLRIPTQQDLEDIKAGKFTEESIRNGHKIPYGWGFDLVSCANYFWEICSWFSFAFLTRMTFGWIFAFTTLAILMSWAYPKHQRYKRMFDGQDGRELYPPRRKALIPYFY